MFSNGLLDPWSSGGVLKNISKSVVAVVLPLGAHHLDLMFPTDADPPSAPKPAPAANLEFFLLLSAAVLFPG